MRIYPNLSGNQTEALQKLTCLFYETFSINVDLYPVFHENFRSFFASKDSFTKYDYYYILAILSYFNNKFTYPNRYTRFPVYTLDLARDFNKEQQVFVKSYDYFLNTSDYSNFNAKEFLLISYTQEELDSIFESYYLIADNIDFNYEVPELSSRSAFNQFKNIISAFLSNFTLIKKSLLLSFQKDDKTFFTRLTKEIATNFIDSSIQTNSLVTNKNALFNTSPHQEDIFTFNCFSPEIEDQLPSRINSITVSSFCTGTKTSSFDLKSITKRQFFTNKGAFAFFTYSQKCLFSDQDFNFFFLANTSSYGALAKYKKARVNIKKLSNYLIKNECLYFIDRDAYNQKIQKSLGKYNKYCSNWAELLVTANDVDQLELESSTFVPDEKDYIHISSSDSDLIFSKVNLDSANPDYTKAKDAFDKLYASTLQKSIDSAFSFKKQVSKVVMYLNTFRSAQQRLYEFYHEALRIQFENTTFPSNSSYTFVNKVAERYIPLQQERNNYLNNFNYEEVDIVDSNLFTNLNKTYNIELISISYESDGTQETINSDTISSESIKKMLVATNTSKNFQFTEIEFFTCKPSKILPDGNDSKAVVGGPYRIKFTSTTRHSNVTLQLSLKDISSIFGKHGGTMYIHPHASPRAFTTSYKDLLAINTTACLGESSSYLYKAVKSNNLSSIIINIFTWLNSANSADTWGKNYKYFPKYSSLIFNNEVPQDTPPTVNLKEAITTAIVSEETTELNTLDTPTIEDGVSSPNPVLEVQSLAPAYRPEETVFLQEQPAVTPVSEIPVVESTTSIEPEALVQLIRAETTSPVNTYTPYVRT